MPFKPLKSISAISAALLKKHLYHKFRPVDDQTGDEDMEDKIVVVTEAADAMGKVLAQQFAKRRAIVVMGSHDFSKCQSVAQDIKKRFRYAQVVPMKLDMADFDSVRSCADEIVDKFSHISVLVNNASLLSPRTVIGRTEAGHERHMATNHFGQFLFTLMLTQHLKRGAPSRVVCVGSSAFQMATLDMDDLDMEVDKSLGEMNLHPFGNSKFCNYLFVKALGKRLEGTDVRTYYVCPGFNQADLVWIDWTRIPGCTSRANARAFCGSAEQGAETILYCAMSTHPEVAEETGKPYHFRKLWREIDTNYGGAESLAEELWDQTEIMVGTTWVENS